MKKKVDEIVLTTTDLRTLEEYLIKECGLDTLDIAELLLKIEELKNVSINI